MATSEDIKIIIEAQDKASKQLDAITKSLGGLVDKAEETGTKLGNVSKTLMGAFSLGAVGSFLKQSIDEFAKAEKSAMLLEQTLKQTGNTTGMTAKQIMDYAQSIESATGIEAESVQAAAMQLSRNSKVTGEQFKELLRLGTDMSVVLGGDVASNAMFLAKALEDPATAVGKLTKAGISFTAEQKKTIAALIETGNSAKAVGIIMGEVDRQFAGAAETLGNTTAGKLVKLSNAYSDLKEATGAGFVTLFVEPVEDFANAWNGVDSAKIQKVLESLKGVGVGTPVEIGSAGGAIDDFKVLEDRLKKLLASRGQVQDAIEGLQEVGAAEALDNVFGDGSIAEEANQQWGELHTQLEQINQDIKNIHQQADALRNLRLFELTAIAGGAGAAGAANQQLFNQATQGGVAGQFASGAFDGAQGVLDRQQQELAESILRSNQTQKQKLEKELQQLFSVETLLPADEFTRIRERIEAELKAIAAQVSNAGIQGLMGGANAMFDIAEREVGRVKAEKKIREREMPGLQALESRFLTRGPGNDPALAAHMEGNKIARDQLKVQQEQVREIKQIKLGGQFPVRGI